MTTLDEAWAALGSGIPASALEDGRLEFKQEAASVKKTLEVVSDAVVCLANAEGGTIVVGVADAPEVAGSLTGVSEQLTVTVLAHGIFDRTQPALSVPVDERYESGARLLIVTVPRGATLYANSKGLSTRRVGTQCRPFPPDQQKQALSARGLYDWSAELVGRGLSSAEAGEIERIRSLLRTAGREETARLPDDRLLGALRLTRAGELTRAGVLLVGTAVAIEETIPTYGYAYQYRQSPGRESTSRLREARPLLAAIGRVLDAVEARRVIHPINVAGGVQLQLHDYPAGVVRELVVNALVHRDYDFAGSVEVEHSAERLVVTSPGGLVFGVTPDNILTHPSTPRNRLLLEVVTTLQVAERTGQGVDRVYRELLRAGKPPPDYEDDGRRVMVTVRGGTGNDAFVRFLEAHVDSTASTDVEVLLALSLLRNRRTLTAEQLAPSIQQSPAEAQRTLQRLAEQEVIAPSRRTARHTFPTYSLSSTALSALGAAVPYHRSALTEVDGKVAAHVAEYGFITNQTLRRLFNLSVYPARDLLRDLQIRGVLIKLDDKTSGPGVRYGPGPSFPQAAQRRGRRPRQEDA